MEVSALPEQIQTEDELDELLTRPQAKLAAAITQLRDPLLVLGASGKMGPSLCVLARRAAEMAGHKLSIVAASRFSNERARAALESQGIQTVACDFLDRSSLEPLPESANIIYLVGMKFGTQDNPALTWAVNTLIPSHVAERFPESRIVALSTGNVYPFVPPDTLGATETLPTSPVGEYANAALARERIFEHYSRIQGTMIVRLRLNYAVELRYGVLSDIAQRVWNRQPVELANGYLNCIWQGDANDMILRSVPLAASPASLFNLTAPAVLSVRDLAAQFGALMDRPPLFDGKETDTALLSNPQRLCTALGAPSMPLAKMIQWTSDWVMGGGRSFGKPTHFEVKTGQY